MLLTDAAAVGRSLLAQCGCRCSRRSIFFTPHKRNMLILCVHAEKTRTVRVPDRS